MECRFNFNGQDVTKEKTSTLRTENMLSGATNLVTDFPYCSNTSVKEVNVKGGLDIQLICHHEFRTCSQILAPEYS